MSNFALKGYWDKIYNGYFDKKPFDWLEDWQSLKGILEPRINKKDKILNIGCGNACLTEDMYDNGYHNIINMDFSQVVIDQMQSKNSSRHKMVYETGDVLDMKYADQEFDIVIDKSTLDAISCGGKGSYVNMARALFEVQRVLKTGGICIVISYGEPDSRVFHYQREHLCFGIDKFCMNPMQGSNMVENFVPGWGGNPEKEEDNWCYILVKKVGANCKTKDDLIQIEDDIRKEEFMVGKQKGHYDGKNWDDDEDDEFY